MKTTTTTTNKYRLSSGWSDSRGSKIQVAEHPLDDIQGFIKDGEAESSSLRCRDIASLMDKSGLGGVQVQVEYLQSKYSSDTNALLLIGVNGCVF